VRMLTGRVDVGVDHCRALRDLGFLTEAAVRSKVLVVAQAVAICGVIAVLAWSKSRGITVVIPYFPHRRSLAVRAK
jgi:hypothetical protein